MVSPNKPIHPLVYKLFFTSLTSGIIITQSHGFKSPKKRDFYFKEG